MKYLFMIIAITIVSCNPKTDQSRAKSAIKEYVKAHFNDPQSYEPIALYMDSVFTTFKKTFDGTKMLSSIEQLRIIHKYEKADSIQNVYDSLNSNYRGAFIGWNIYHSYRAKNAFGGTVIGELLLECNPEFSDLSEKR